MNSKLDEKKYNRYEFIASVLLVQKHYNITLKEAFYQVYKTAKELKIKTGFSLLQDDAYNQFKTYYYNNIDYFNDETFLI